MSRLGGGRRNDECPEGGSANFLERTGQTGRIAGELNRGRIGQELLLAGDGALYQFPQKRSSVTDHDKQHTGDHLGHDGTGGSFAGG